MSKTLHLFVGVTAIVGGATLFAMHIEEFRNHLKMRDNSVAGQGYVTEVKIIGGKSELHYEFSEYRKEKIYSGMSVLEGTHYEALHVGLPTPVDYLRGNPEINRHQFARDEIYARGRNIAVGALLVVIGFALIGRGLRASKTTTNSEPVEVAS